MTSTKTDNLWPRFESLFLDHYCPNFWSWADIDLPYGSVMVIDPDDMPTMLWRADLNKTSDFGTVLNDLTKIEDEHSVPVGFSISSSWNGDVGSFKEFISRHGFEIKSLYNWLAKDISVTPEQTYQSGFIIEQSNDFEAISNIMEKGFSKEVAQIFLDGAIKNSEDPSRVYFVAKDPNTLEVVGCGAACHRGNLAYMSCLAVDPDYTKRGIAKDLVRARINYLKTQGVDFIVTAVNETNEASMAVQTKSGYKPFETTEYWMKPNVI